MDNERLKLNKTEPLFRYNYILKMLLQFTSDMSSFRVEWHMQIWNERLYRLVTEYVTKKWQMTSALDELKPHLKIQCWAITSQIAKFMGPTWDPPGSCRPQMGPMLAPWTRDDINISAAVCFENEDFAAILLFWSQKKDVLINDIAPSMVYMVLKLWFFNFFFHET